MLSPNANIGDKHMHRVALNTASASQKSKDISQCSVATRSGCVEILNVVFITEVHPWRDVCH